MSDLQPEYDASAVRAAFPALAEGPVRFDAPGGSQTPAVVAQAVARAMTEGLCQRGTATPSERRTDQVTLDARSAMADLLDADPAGVAFGRSMTQLTMDLARTLAEDWGPGDEIVVSRLDHDANIRPWLIAAQRVGAMVRWLEFDPVTTEPAPIESVLSERTRLVAITAASNLFGTRPHLGSTAAAVHDVGALLSVDAVHLVPHAPVSLSGLGADVVLCSPYKFFGPHLGVLAADPAFLETLHPDKLLPSSDAVPERFELGTLPYELLAGVTACVDFLADLTTGEGNRPTRLRAAMTAVHQHEVHLAQRLTEGLSRLDGLTIHGTPRSRTPTFPITAEQHTPRQVSDHLADHGILAPAGHFYAIEAARHAGLGDGVTRVGLSAYTTRADIDVLLQALATIATA